MGHGGDESEGGIFLLGLTKLVQKDRILGSVVGVEEDEFLGESIVRGLEDDAANWGDANAPGEEDGGDAGVAMQSEFAHGASRVSSVPRGIFFSERLNAESRIRVVMNKSSS